MPPPLKENFQKNLFHKNAIKLKLVDFLAIATPKVFWQKSELPHPLTDFQWL
jgi:hypothetical protein